MAKISPMLSNSLKLSGNIQNNNFNALDKKNEQNLDKNLLNEANKIKPNKAKAQLIKQGPITSAISSVKDTGKDAANFVKAAKTGKMGDNNLGRINDLGMKIGAGIIAAYLAAHSKTKTDAIMKFVGGGTFIAAMSIWPKLFINLPARLVHGFRIDQRYISAQGDKKDFFLDNQFLPWDAFSKEEMAQNAKRAGIDFESENGEEKIRRKMQKTALQNRTLWMATAGFATPLMTAHIGNKVEPLIKEAVIKHDFNKTKGIVNSSLEEYIKNGKNITQTESINALFKNYDGSANNDLFNELGKKLTPSTVQETFRSADDSKIISKYSPTNINTAIKGIWEQTPVSNVAKLKDLMSQIEVVDTDNIDDLFSEAETVKKLAPEKIDEIINSLGENVTIAKVKEKLKELNVSNKEMDAAFSFAEVDSNKFKEAIVTYDKEILGPIRTKLKNYINLSDSIFVERAESVYTKAYSDTLKSLFKDFDFAKGKIKEISASEDVCAQELENFFKNLLENVNYGSDEYKELINKLTKVANSPLQGEVKEVAEKLANKEMISKILESGDLSDEAKEILKNYDLEGLNKAIAGDMNGSLVNVVSNYIKNQKANIDATMSRLAICVNFEARLKAGEIKVDGKNIADDEVLGLVDAARKIIYRGNISNFENNAGIQKSTFKKLWQAIFKEEAFENEPQIVKEQIARYIKQIDENGVKSFNATEKYLQNADLIKRVQDYAKNLSNNKAWMKIFGPMAAGLVAVTLLVQPLFGKIDKEFPEENKNGGAK